MTLDLPLIGTVVAGTITAAVAIGTLGLKWSEHRYKQRIDRHPERLAVYNALQALLLAVAKHLDVSQSELSVFHQALESAEMLFPRHIRRYLKEVWKQATQLRAANAQYDARLTPPDHDSTRVTHSIAIWLIGQQEVAKKKFRRCLNTAA